MSDALNYLIKTRPETVSHYFAFLKETGKHLDPKTRNLISVITKVHAQTDRGFRQYLSRALREGCTPMEVLDALLMAFPALGLAKITWAVDIILDMNLPGFAPEVITRTAPEPGRWRDVMAMKEVPDGDVLRTECEGRGLFIYREGRSVQVFDSRCPHQATDMPASALAGCTLACPRHGWRFDLRSGACTAVGDRPLRQLPSRAEGGRLLVQW